MGAWREAYQESINPISVPEDGWSVPQVMENSEVLPPETRRSLGRNKKRIMKLLKTKSDYHKDHRGVSLVSAVDVVLVVIIEQLGRCQYSGFVCCVLHNLVKVFQTSFA